MLRVSLKLVKKLEKRQPNVLIGLFMHFPFEADGREFAIFLRSLEQLIYSNSWWEQFLKQNSFLTCSWRFLIYNQLEQLKFKLEKLIGIRNMQKKLENNKSAFFLVLFWQVKNIENTLKLIDFQIRKLSFVTKNYIYIWFSLEFS